MKRLMTAICCASVIGLSSLAAAQTQSGSGSMDKMDKSKMGKEMKVTGCVMESTDNMGHFMLNDAMMNNEMKGGGMKEGSKPMMSYMLMGGDLKAHVGHKVEVTGMMADSMMGNDKMAKDAMTKDSMGKSPMQTLTVKSVKMVAATCK